MMEKNKLIRTILLGIDGASFKLIQPLMDQGKLPNFVNLLARGAKAVLHSTPPTLGPSIWTTIITGKLAGKHGIHDFFREHYQNNEIIFNSSLDRKSKPLWSMVSEGQKSVAVAELLMTHPPEKVRGHMVSSLIVPTPSTRAGHRSAAPTHPPELAEEIINNLGRFEWAFQYEANGGKQQEIMEFALASLRYRLELFRFLLKKQNEFNLFYLDEIDMICHVSHWAAPERSPRHEALAVAYQLIDDFIGEIIAECPTDLIVVSDHGFQPLRKTVSLNNFLASIGLLAYLPPTFGGRLKKAAFHTPLRVLFQKKENKLPVTIDDLLEGVNWGATRAYCLGTNAGTIYLNPGHGWRDKIFPHEIKTLSEFISNKLKELRDPETGQPVVRRVYKKEEILSGPHAEDAPDLFVLFHEGYCVKISRNDHLQRHKIITAADNWTGCHDEEGMFIAAGPHFEQGVDIGAVAAEDITPTILYLLDLPVPNDLDGKILREAFDRRYAKSHAIEYIDQQEDDQQEKDKQQSARAYNVEDARQLMQRLRIFGHLD